MPIKGISPSSLQRPTLDLFAAIATAIEGQPTPDGYIYVRASGTNIFWFDQSWKMVTYSNEAQAALGFRQIVADLSAFDHTLQDGLLSIKVWT